MNKKQTEIPLGKRNNYYYGKLLTAEDFSDEQAYFRNRMKLHNRMLHGYGIVSGLEVSYDDKTKSILVNPGAAIDGQGNEIFLATPVRCPLPEKGVLAYLVLCWAERETDPVPAPGGNESDRTVPSLVEEYALLMYQSDPKGTNNGGIVLARLNILRGKWKIDKKFRLRRAKPSSSISL